MTYILIVFLLFALGLIKYALNLKKQSIVPFLILTLFIGLRDGIGSDFNNYYEYFLAFNSIEYNIKYEPIYFYLNTLLPNIYTVNLISSLIMFIPLYIICNKYKINSYLFCILFMFSDSFFASFNIVRQLISASWIMLSFAYLLEKKYYKFLICLFVSLGFHYSSIYLLVISVFIYYTNLSILFYISTCVLTFILSKLNLITFFTSFLSIISSNYTQYIENSNTYSQSGAKFILELLIFAVYPLLFLRKSIVQSTRISFYLKLFLVGISLSFAAIQLEILYRFSYSFIFFQIIYIPLLITTIEKEKKEQSIKTVNVKMVLLYFLAFIIFILNIYSETFGVVTYDWSGFEKIFIY